VFPSLRLAYAVLPRALVPVFDAVRRQLDDHTHGFMQAVLVDFIAGGHFTAHLRAMRALYQQRRDVLVDACMRQLPRGVALAPVVCGMNAAVVLPRAARPMRSPATAAASARFPCRATVTEPPRTTAFSSALPRSASAGSLPRSRRSPRPSAQ
jgi:GntR family transcriptional regulator/MocR family aminotransferase